MLMLGMNRRAMIVLQLQERLKKLTNRSIRAPSTDTQTNDSLIFELVREVEEMNHPR
jgi:hypothetical protein